MLLDRMLVILVPMRDLQKLNVADEDSDRSFSVVEGEGHVFGVVGEMV